MVRAMVRGVMRKVAKALNKLSGGRITANMITVTSLAGHVFIAWLIMAGYPIKAAILLIIFGLMDTLDGELARLQGKASPAGMLLDASADRIKEILIYIAFAYVIVAVGRPYMAGWAVAACGASLLVSYVKAKGESALASANVPHHELNKIFQDGIMRFEVRMAIVVLALLTGRIILGSMIIAIGAGLTAIYRLITISRKLA